MGTTNLTDILTNGDEDDPSLEYDQKSALAGWITSHVNAWIDHRDQNFRTKWEEYYRIVTGKWMDSDKTRKSERSKLISPALQQAVEATVAELEEATFGSKGVTWFDLHDDVRDEVKEDMEQGKPKRLHYADNNAADSKDRTGGRR